MEVRPKTRRNYPPANYCIYCATTNGPLGNEHIVPFGLAGNSLVLKKASCDSCAKVINKFETFLMREAWYPFRAKLGMPTRNKQQPTTFKLDRHSEGKDVSPKIVSVDDFPTILALPVLPSAGALVGRAVKEPTGHGTWYVHEGMGKHFRVGEGTSVPFSEMDFCRLLAKIAHGFAIAELGKGAFNPYLAAVILGRATFSELLQFVGGDLADNQDYKAPPPKEGVLHSLSKRKQRVGNSWRLIVDVRLFSHFGAPQYHVVIGRFGAK